MLEIVGQAIIDLDINGAKYSVSIRAADTLLDVLRKKLGLTGAKNACETGDCGACTILVDGQPIKACQMLAVEAIGHRVTTIEALENTPIQKAFIEKFAVQCGYCTPGMIMNSHALINTHPDATDEIIAEWLESNICRCTGYHEIKEAIRTTMSQVQSQL